MAKVEKSGEFGGGKSLMRRWIEPSSFWLMRKFHEVPLFARITPNDMSVGRVVLNTVATLIQQEAHLSNRNLSLAAKIGLGGVKAMAYYADKGDGSLADVFDVREPGKHDRKKGGRKDAEWDRREEALGCFIRGVVAFMRGNIFGMAAAFIDASTVVEPSIRRAEVETLGIKPRELSIGTRFTRCVLSEIAGLSPRLQPWVDLASAGANLYTAYTRERIYKENKDRVAQPETEDEARKRAEIIDSAHERLTGLHEVRKEIIWIGAATLAAICLSSFQSKKS